MVFAWEAVILSGFISIIASSSYVAASILLPNLLRALVLARRLPKDVVKEESLFSWASSFDENW